VRKKKRRIKMATTTEHLSSKILTNISLIAGKYQAYVGINPQTHEISADNFGSVNKLIAFNNDVESFLNTLNLQNFAIRTQYNPYRVIISWRK
jgi:hypothetical protein